MTIQHNNYLSRIARRAEQGARPAIPPQVAVENVITVQKKKKKKENEKRKENKNKNKMKTVQLLNATKRFKIGSLNT